MAPRSPKAAMVSKALSSAPARAIRYSSSRAKSISRIPGATRSRVARSPSSEIRQASRSASTSPGVFTRREGSTVGPRGIHSTPGEPERTSSRVDQRVRCRSKPTRRQPSRRSTAPTASPRGGKGSRQGTTSAKRHSWEA